MISTALLKRLQSFTAKDGRWKVELFFKKLKQKRHRAGYFSPA